MQIAESHELSAGELREARAATNNQKAYSRQVWALRIGGLLLLVGGWAIIAIPDAGAPSAFVVDSVIFGFLGAFAFIAAARGRRIGVELEKRLRLALMVHNMELENLSMRDDLTGLFSRRYFFDRLERALLSAKGFQQSLSVVFIDIDEFKVINDNHGHATGDQVLAGFGRFLLEQARGSDVPARIGGDEFAVILPDTPEEGARIVVERLLEAVEKARFMEDDDETRVAISVGISGYPYGGADADAIMQMADSNMYAHKRGKQCGEAAPPVTADHGIPEAFRKAPDQGSPAKAAESPPPAA